MIQIEEILNGEFNSLYHDYDSRSGILRFSFYRIKANYEGKMPSDEYSAHLVVARQTIEKVNYEANFHWNRVSSKGQRDNFPTLTTDFNNLNDSGIKLTPEEFFGASYNWEEKKPLIRGKTTNFLNSYFLYDHEENSSNIQEISLEIERLKSLGIEFNAGFAHAFLEPPYGTRFGKTIKEKGDYFNNFVQTIFSEVEINSYYNWSIDCSNFFDSVKEWWGGYFWTVYNSKLDIYVGIVGSETD